ncbi:hypothetical protein [Stutzerimonas stutzeri]|nr:hypothetical protein [Stutzerimonas stutzeri]
MIALAVLFPVELLDSGDAGGLAWAVSGGLLRYNRRLFAPSD